MTASEKTLGKVTVFITRRAPRGVELLLFEHPNAGIQIPAGTLEEGETPEKAALREAAEETGLTGLHVRRYLGYQDWRNPGHHFTLCPTKVYARPDPTSFDWAEFPRGVMLRRQRQEAGFVQAVYEEGDRYPDAEYTTYSILGWVLEACLCEVQRRYFFHLAPDGPTPDDSWSVFTDYHTFRPFWADLADLPPIIAFQAAWLSHVRQGLNYRFE